MENIITLENVSKKYKDRTILENMNFSFEKGKCYGIVGRNGSGKSVLLKLIVGFAYPDSGNITIRGKQLKKDIDFVDDAGVIINSPEFINGMSGLNNLLYLADIRKKTNKERIIEVLRNLDLEGAMKKRVSTYSQGMKQRLRLAQAIMEEPELLILDEPMNALDDDAVREIREMLLSLKNEGKTIILTSHNSEDIDLLCDSVCEIGKGKLEKIR
ncbi:MAG: ATP-binding cassette domain-containing protein [Oscillospiraceae bacterium]|nr:ATP-binding cassette domain-containing protein [Oscillospiraceae bacterium]